MVHRQPFHSTTPSSIGFTNFKSSPKPKWKVGAVLVYCCVPVRFVCAKKQQARRATTERGIHLLLRQGRDEASFSSRIAVPPTCIHNHTG